MITRLFPVWAPCAALAGYYLAPLFSQAGGAIVPLLTLVMLCMGLTLKPADFVSVAKSRNAVLAGLLLQFTVMPLTALLIARLMGLGPELSVGLLLVGSVAGGTSSNVMTFIAKGDVALSISMTTLSTLLGVVMTPLLLTLLAGTKVQIPALDMLVSLIGIILVPVSLGVMISYFANRHVREIETWLAPLSVIAILIIIAIVVALNAAQLSMVVLAVVFATLAHNVAGLALGYLSARLLGFNSVVCRTIAIEVGMQNSGLATALALKFFTPLSALPGAIFSVWLNITGSIFASYCLREDRRAALNLGVRSKSL